MNPLLKNLSKETEIDYTHLLNGKDVTIKLYTLEMAFEAIMDDFNLGSAGKGSLYDLNTKIVWSILPLIPTEIKEGFKNMVISKVYPDLYA